MLVYSFLAARNVLDDIDATSKTCANNILGEYTGRFWVFKKYYRFS